MSNLRYTFKFATSTIGAAAVLLSCGSPVMAHAPLKYPLPSTHLLHVPVSPIHAELERALSGVTPMSHTSGIPFDLSFHNYPQEQHEKLTSIVVLLVHSERFDKSGDFKRRDEVNAQARKLLFSLGKQTVLKVGRDAQFLQLNVLKHLFQLGT